MSIESGFLGTRAPLVPDLIVAALLAVVPAFAVATALAAAGRTRLHHLVMWITYHVLLAVVLAFVGYNLAVHVPSPDIERSPLYRTVYLPLVVFHIAIASSATVFGGWLALATRRWARPAAAGREIVLEPARARLHRRAGAVALSLFGVAVGTGLAIYYFRYIYIYARVPD